MIGGIVITHGPIGEALLVAAQTILGEVNEIYALSTTDLSLAAILEKLKDIIQTTNWDDGTIIMASLKGGSCWNAAVSTAKNLQGIEVISGVNLPMLLSFLTKRDQFSLNELASIIKQDALKGIDQLIN